ncbi:transporter substrate-binding domain-containing protein [Mesorhizobium sp. NBSH29]|uniref:transporter substrate-binding domain-containing protein n=1 Tax=Mesorhizobium sp. NBSH29 TaxID=2654249 RepID=UPI001AEE7847|nr:transporter substrate-binding domain-containing protein [Mesorhizobium sp. NBSH29]
MNFKIIVSATLIGATMLVGSQAIAAEPLRIGVEGAYPPFSKKEADGTLSGFDIDIALAICAELKRECELVEQEWDGMIPALISRKYDAIVASMSITEDRKKKVSFSKKYYQTPTRFIAKKGADYDFSKEGSKGLRIGLLRGTTYQCYVEKHTPDAVISLYSNQEDVYTDLAAGRLDAQISNSIQAVDGFLSTDAGKDFDFIGGDLDDAACLGEGVGVAVRKDDPLADEISTAISAMRTNGTYKAANDKYFPFDVYGN